MIHGNAAQYINSEPINLFRNVCLISGRSNSKNEFWRDSCLSLVDWIVSTCLTGLSSAIVMSGLM